VKCLLLTDWRNIEKFSQGVQEILMALGKELIQPTSTDFRFYCKYFDVLGDLEVRTAQFAGVIGGASFAVQYGSEKRGIDCIHWVLHKHIDDDNMDNPLPEMGKFLECCKLDNTPSASKIGAARKIIEDVEPMISPLWRKSYRTNTDSIYQSCINLVACLQELRNEFAAIMASQFSIHDAQPIIPPDTAR